MVPFPLTDRRVIRLVGTLVVSLLAASPAAARPIVVGTGTPESCMEAALQLALLTAAEERGGVIRFDCGEAPATIDIARLLPGEARPARLVVPDRTTIDGGGLITIDGGGKDGILVLVPAAARVELHGLTVRGGPYGLTVFNLGRLAIDRSTIRDNVFGAIYNWFGTLRVQRSLLTRNGSFVDGGGAIVNFRGTLTVDRSAFIGNLADGGGAGIDNSGVATVRDSVFTLNVGHWRGGAFLNNRDAEARIVNCEFSDNGDLVDGGAVSNDGMLTIRNSSITDNRSDTYGGGLYAGDQSTTVLVHTLVTRNQAGFGGGGIYLAPGSSPPTLIRTTVTGNFPDDIGRQ
jgi:hypothetical protein